MSDQKYYVLSLEHMRGGIACWWRPEGGGYTNDLKQAGVYDLAGAIDAVGRRSRGKGLPPEIAIPIDSPLVIRHTVDLYQQALPFEQFVNRYEVALIEAAKAEA